VFGTPRNLRPHYNIAPSTIVDVIPLDREGRRELVSMRWGLVPYLCSKVLCPPDGACHADATMRGRL
jgi:putative SOS response-associated peptidase YedK